MTTIPNNKKIVILGGGTNTYISNHLALSAPAYGTTAKILANKFRRHEENKMEVDLYLTKMASSDSIHLGRNLPDTPEEIEELVDVLIADPATRVIIFNVAIVDYKPTSLFTLESNSYDAYNPREITDKFGKYASRLNTSKLPEVCLELSVQDKIIQKIRKERKDILLVGFKTTCGATKEEQFQKGLKLCKDASANIVFVNDVDKGRIEKLNNHLKASDDVMSRHYLNQVKTELDNEGNIKKELWKEAKIKNMEAIEKLQNNGLVTPEESSYWYNTRDEALDALVQMVLDRSHLHFTRSTVVDAETIPWNSEEIPKTFKTIFNFVRGSGAYKLGPNKNTVGHFGLALSPNEFLTSKRKTDFNKIEEVGLVRVITDDPDDVFGYKHFFTTKEELDVLEILSHLKTELELCKKQSNTQPNQENLQKRIGFYKSKLKFIETQREDKVIAFGAKPSVGGQSQRSLFQAFPDLNCIIHFHCPLKPESRSLFNTTKQFSYECGSKECIASNLTGFKEYKVSDTYSIWAGHMDYHGPNIVFNSNINPQLVIDFISSHWDLSKKTTGLSSELV